eukprot:1246527-Amphidinium_carterae.1
MESITGLSVALLLEAARAPPAASSSETQEVHIYDQQALSVLAFPETNATLAQAAAVVLDVTVPTHVSLAGLLVPAAIHLTADAVQHAAADTKEAPGSIHDAVFDQFSGRAPQRPNVCSALAQLWLSALRCCLPCCPMGSANAPARRHPRTGTVALALLVQAMSEAPLISLVRYMGGATWGI